MARQRKFLAVKKPITVSVYQTEEVEYIHTLEGIMKANVGDYVITASTGERWPVRNDIFKLTYEIIEVPKE